MGLEGLGGGEVVVWFLFVCLFVCLVLVGDVGAAALTSYGPHPVTVGRPYTVIVRVLRQVRASLRPRHAATAAQRVHTGRVQHVVVHQVCPLPCYVGGGGGGGGGRGGGGER